MPWKKNLNGVGIAGATSQAVAGELDVGVTSTGSTSQANSYQVRAPITVVTTTGANTGVRLPSILAAGDSGIIQNNGGATLFVYPPVGGKLNAGSTDAKVDVGTLKQLSYTCIDNLNFSVNLGA